MAKQIIVWLGIFVVWLLSTRQFHPTFLIAFLATAILISSSALGVYMNKRLLLSRFSQSRSWVNYATSLIVGITALDLIAVISIQKMYDQLWGPDPNRFGFWFNIASDGAIITLHIIVAQGVTWAAKGLRNRRMAGV